MGANNNVLKFNYHNARLEEILIGRPAILERANIFRVCFAVIAANWRVGLRGLISRDELDNGIYETSVKSRATRGVADWTRGMGSRERGRDIDI